MRRNLLVLATLYFVQGLPYGFQLTALPVYLREAGVSLANIGLASVLSLPWILKIVWGPAVDRFGGGPFGRRRSWILPLQLGLGLACLVASRVPPESGLFWLVLTVLLMNLFAATMDVAVDGLAIDLLPPSQLGYGNIAQVVGYKLGILTGGGLLVWASGRIGWQGIFGGMAALVFAGFLVTAMFREPSSHDSVFGPPAEAPPEDWRDVFRSLWAALRLPGSGWLLFFIGTYKTGETMAEVMFRPFLYDAGYTREQIGLYIGTYGVVCSLIGSFAGGWLASRWSIFKALSLAAVLRALAVAGEWWLSLVEPTQARVVLVVAMEQAFGGALTTALFAFMMSRVDRRIGATHYTLLATVEVFGKMISSSASGFVAQGTSYSTLFGLATGLAFAFLLLLVPISRLGPPRGAGFSNGHLEARTRLRSKT